jgi:hypothetical protein
MRTKNASAMEAKLYCDETNEASTRLSEVQL